MSNLFSLLFSALILVQSSNISFDDLSKLNILLEHAKYHQETYGDSFLDFLAEHYGEKTASHQNEHKEHEILPFKHYQDCNHISHDFTVSPHFYLDNCQQNIIQIAFNFFYEDSSSLFEKPSVFQPPKLA